VNEAEEKRLLFMIMVSARDNDKRCFRGTIDKMMFCVNPSGPIP